MQNTTDTEFVPFDAFLIGQHGGPVRVRVVGPIRYDTWHHEGMIEVMLPAPGTATGEIGPFLRPNSRVLDTLEEAEALMRELDARPTLTPEAALEAFLNGQP